MVNDIIARKRDGGELDEARLRAFVSGVVDGSIPAYQASALLMAIVLRGFSPDETLGLARAMVDSGKVLDLSVLGRPVLDKHSSGGVGDKVTLVLAPLVASCGALFGKMSGRGLGHTGGTLDKLESIPGFRVQLSQGDFLRQLERIGVAVVSQSERLVPADRILYALRDVTATVDSEGLIAASIMAKKIASGTSALVLDLTVGSGAFMKTIEQAASLGALCRLIGAELRAHGRAASTRRWRRRWVAPSATGSRSRRPGRCSAARGPDDVREVVLSWPPRCWRWPIWGSTRSRGERARERALDSGQAAEWFERWVAVQGGRFKPGEFHRLACDEVVAGRDGWVSAVDALRRRPRRPAFGGGPRPGRRRGRSGGGRRARAPSRARP